MANNRQLMDSYHFWRVDDHFSNWVSKNNDNFYVYNIDFGRDDGLRTAHVLFGDADQLDPKDCDMGPVKAREMWGLYTFARAAYGVDAQTGQNLCATVESFLHSQGIGNKSNYQDHHSHVWHMTWGAMGRNDFAASYMLERFHGINLTAGGPDIDYFNYALRLTALSDLMDGFKAVAEKLGYASLPDQEGLNRAQIDGLFNKLWKAGSVENLLSQKQDAGSSAQLWQLLDHAGKTLDPDLMMLAKFAFGAIQTIFHVDEADYYYGYDTKNRIDDEFTWLAKHDGHANTITAQDLLEAVDPNHHNDHAGSHDSIMNHKQTELAGFM